MKATGERRGQSVARTKQGVAPLAATLEAIAVPIAPPICVEVFSSPEASPIGAP